MKTTIHLLFSLGLLAQNSFGQNAVLTSTTFGLPGAGTGSYNVAIGAGNSYPSANNASFNVFVGESAGTAITTGDFNAFSGYHAGQSNTTGSWNVFTGMYAGSGITTGNYNTIVGVGAGTGSGIGTASSNAFLGQNAGYKNSGDYNVFLGREAGRSNTTGSSNVAIAYQAAYRNFVDGSIGNGNVMIGEKAGYTNVADGNVFVGNNSGFTNLAGGANTFLGSSSGEFNTIGSANTFLGKTAGWNNSTGSDNTFVGNSAGIYNSTGHHNTYLGASCGAPTGYILQYAAAMGYGAEVKVNNGLVLGRDDVLVGIGTSSPDQRLSIKGNVNFLAYDNSLRLKNQPFLHFNEHESLALGIGAELAPGAKNTLVLGSSEMHVQLPGVAKNYLANSAQVLTIDAQGKVLLTKPRVQIENASDWADKVFEADYVLRPLSEVEDFVKKNKHLSDIPSAETMVAEGIESAAFNAKLLEKIEELTLYVVALEKRLKQLERE